MFEYIIYNKNWKNFNPFNIIFDRQSGFCFERYNGDLLSRFLNTWSSMIVRYFCLILKYFFYLLLMAFSLSPSISTPLLKAPTFNITCILKDIQTNSKTLMQGMCLSEINHWSFSNFQLAQRKNDCLNV